MGKINLCIEDDNYCIWLWDGEWLRVDDPTIPAEENGYHDVRTFEDVVRVLTEGGYIEPPEPE